MQLTRLDRWLKERFIYETHILTLRLPDCGLPKGVVVTDVEQTKSGDYRHRLVVKNNKLASEVVDLLKGNQVMYAIHVVEGKHWYNERIAPKGKSFTYRWIFRFFAFVGICFIGLGLYKFLQNEDFKDTLKDTFDEIRGGL